MDSIGKVPGAACGLFALLVAFAVAPAARAAEGDCTQWSVDGPRIVSQSNGTTVRMQLTQTGTRVLGDGQFSAYDNDEGRAVTIGGPVDGTLDGNVLRLNAYWSDRHAGAYLGQISPDGHISGTAHDVNDPANKATFQAGEAMCVARAGPAAKTGPALGRVQIDPNTPRPSICDAAVSARARNSPAAPGLERQCAEQQRARLLQPPVRASVPGKVETPALPPIGPPSAGAASAAGVAVPEANVDLDAVAAGRNRGLAARGAAIGDADPGVQEARDAVADAAYRFGFDVGTGMFGDSAFGAMGRKTRDGASDRVRATLDAPGQAGFDAAMTLHLARHYGR